MRYPVRHCESDKTRQRTARSEIRAAGALGGILILEYQKSSSAQRPYPASSHGTSKNCPRMTKSSVRMQRSAVADLGSNPDSARQRWPCSQHSPESGS